MTTEEHIHAKGGSEFEFLNTCRCGLNICLSKSPDNSVGCTKTEGHEGTCQNEWCAIELTRDVPKGYVLSAYEKGSTWKKAE